MCDPVLIAAILEELGYLGDEKEKDKKDEVDAEQLKRDNSKNSGEEEQKHKLLIYSSPPPEMVLTKITGLIFRTSEIDYNYG